MAEITCVRTYEGHKESVLAVAICPNRPHMVTGSEDKMVRLWDLNKGIVLKKMEGHPAWVQAVAVSRDGKLIASGDYWGGLFTWDGDTGKSLKKIVKAHSNMTCSLDFSPDGTTLASGSSADNAMKLWSTKTLPGGNPLSLDCGDRVTCVRYSPSGEHLAIATFTDVQIWDQSTRECIATFTAHSSTSFPFGLVFGKSLAWSPDGTRLLSGGNILDPTIREWDASTWQQVGDPWTGHTEQINAIAMHGTLVASASDDRHIRLWRLSDQETIAIFDHSCRVNCVTFSIDGRRILGGGEDKKISVWAVPEDALLEDALEEPASNDDVPCTSYFSPSLHHLISRKDDTPNEQASNKDAPNSEQLHQQRSEAEGAIQMAIDTHLDNAPLRLLHTTTGLLCDRQTQISAFKTQTDYKKLLSLIIKRPELRKKHTEEVVATYFRWAMLSHRWDGKEQLLSDIRGEIIYELEAVGSVVKLQSFCNVARDEGYHWAWIDSCCIDQTNKGEVDESLNSMFTWYRDSALTIVYLSDVPPSSKSGALAKSAWNTRGWTVPEFLAPKVIRFYQQDWTLYLDVRSPNHKDSLSIMRELGNATGIDAGALVDFQPGMTGAREKLQWASKRVTTRQEDIAYSLFGIFGVQLPIFYGEKKQKALGRLLQEIVAQSGDITALNWVGKSSEFNSCLPADIFSYQAPPYVPPSLSEDNIRRLVSSLRNAVAVESASNLYSLFKNMNPPRFASRRLQLPCMVFRVTEVRRTPGQVQGACFTYEVEADGLLDLVVTTENELIEFSRARPIRQTFVLVRPWDRCLLELPEPFGLDSESHSREFRLMVHLRQPFGALLLAEQRRGEYKRIASDYDIIAQVRDMASIDDMMDVRRLEIL